MSLYLYILYIYIYATYEVTDMLTRWEESFHNKYVHQIITMYILNILKFCFQSYINKAEKIHSSSYTEKKN